MMKKNERADSGGSGGGEIVVYQQKRSSPTDSTFHSTALQYKKERDQITRQRRRQ